MGQGALGVSFNSVIHHQCQRAHTGGAHSGGARTQQPGLWLAMLLHVLPPCTLPGTYRSSESSYCCMAARMPSVSLRSRMSCIDFVRPLRPSMWRPASSSSCCSAASGCCLRRMRHCSKSAKSCGAQRTHGQAYNTVATPSTPSVTQQVSVCMLALLMLCWHAMACPRRTKLAALTVSVTECAATAHLGEQRGTVVWVFSHDIGSKVQEAVLGCAVQ